MSTEDLVGYYSKLLILQYLEKPNAYAMIKALVTPTIMDNLPLDVQDAFDLETAVGVQLDTIAKYVGVTRSGNGFSGPITLGDDDFRVLIKLAIVQNGSGSSLAQIQQLLHQFFPDEIIVFDYANMRMAYYVSPLAGSVELAQLFITKNLFPKPMGVQLASIIYSPDILRFFGCRTYQLPAFNVSPLNDYLDYHMDYPMLDYSDAF